MGNSCGCCNPPPPNNNSPNPNQSPATPHPHLSSPSPSLESVIHTISQSLGNENPTQKIGLLIRFIDNMLLKIKAPSQHGASTSSSGIQVESVAWSTRAASDIIDIISREANELEKSEVAKELGRVALKAVKLVGESHWIFLGLSMAAYALERCLTVTSNLLEYKELLEKIVHLAKDVEKLGQTIPRDNERLCCAVQVIVEGTVLCCDYSTQGKLSRYWNADVMQSQLEKTSKSIQDITSSLTLTTVVDIKRQVTLRIEESPQKLLDFKPEGIAEKVTQVKEMVDLEGSEAVAALILWGFGGVGKSVLASTVIQELDCLSKGFKFCRVIIDEKTADRASHIKQLQKDIIYDFGGGKLDLRNTEEGRQQVQQVVHNQCCLLFIDNVVDSSYIKQLLPTHFSQIEGKAGSVQASREARLRIVITSRQNNIKQLLNIKKLSDYHVDRLSDTAAKIILRKTILGGDQDESQVNCDFDEEGRITAIAEACRGVPLLLSVFGNYLRVERDQTIYKEVLEALEKGDFDKFTDEENLSERLMFVYNKMRDLEAKEAFLDICIYFHGWLWEEVAVIVGSGNLEILEKRVGLVKRNNKGEVIVHDILRLMGNKMAKETRITNYREFSAVVEDEYKLKNMKGVSLMDNTSLATIESTDLNAMRHSLRVLRLGDWVIINGVCDRAFTELRYLQVGDLTTFAFTDASEMEKLARLYNKSKTGMDFRELPRALKAIHYEIQYPGCEELATLPVENLRTLKMFSVDSSKPVKLPKGFKLPASLEWLWLVGCRKLPETFSHLTNVHFLNLSKCDFESLPEGFGQLTGLKKLFMNYCPNLKYLSEGFGSLCSLTELTVEGCTCLEILPVDFGRLTALQELRMGKCDSLRTLPEDFGGLISLQSLDIAGCISLERLPESFSRLSIKSLALESLLSLSELPESIGKMSSLTRLIVKSCNSLTTLPNSLVQLKMLEYLKITKCIKLIALPKDFGQLSSLTHLIVKDCPVLKELPVGFQELPALNILELRRCGNIVNLSPGFGELNCLEQLYIYSLPLSSLPKGFGNLKRLRNLDILNGFKLETLPKDIENLVSLRTLRMSICPMLDAATMERIVKLQNCSLVRIYSSTKLTEWWEEMQDKEEYPMLVWTREGYPSIKDEDAADWQRAARVALFSLNPCKELNGSSDELMDRSSIAIDVDTTVALISLPFHLQSHHEDRLKNMCELAKKRSRTACSGQLQILICLKGIELDRQRVSAEEEEENIRKALKWLPQGSCAIPVVDIRRRFLVKEVFFRSYSEESKLVCFMADVRVHGKMKFEDGETVGEDDISEKLKQNFHQSEIEEESETPDELLECLKLVCNSEGEESERSVQFPGPAEASMFRMLAQALKRKGIHHFIDCNLKEVDINQLDGNDTCLFICDLNTLAHTKIQQICKNLQSFNFQGVWIPLSSNEKCGIGTYIRTYGYVSLVALLDPLIIQSIKEIDAYFILFDKEGKMIFRAPLSLVMSWDIKVHSFIESEITKVVSKLNDKSALEFLLEDMDILDHEGDKVEKQLFNKKPIFLYVERPVHKLRMKYLQSF
ncbi:hypothetical protein SUGI_1106060 [Cryptomeria japonica]|nr:hypothetical protein SUGI_1106060 [Cryptomeria japonica]